MMIKRLLNAGSGPLPARRIAPMIAGADWQEVRLDIDIEVKPDIVGSIIHLDQSFGPASFDAVWSSHVLEHLYAHEVYPALRQFQQILKPDGFAMVMSPDLEAVASFIVEHGLTAVAYKSPMGPIRPLDMLYGHSRAIEEGHFFMAHRTGFTADRLAGLLVQAGFPNVFTRSENYEICALALMPEADGDAIQQDLQRCGFDFREPVSGS